MANQENLVKIGQEGFSMVDDFYGQTRRSESLPQTHENPVQKSYPKWRNVATSRTIDCNQAAKKYGGVVIMDGRRKYRA